MMDNAYFKKTGNFRYNGDVPSSPATPFQTKEKTTSTKMVKYQCSACRYGFERKENYKGSLSKCPYCGREGTVIYRKMASELLKEFCDV